MFEARVHRARPALPLLLVAAAVVGCVRPAELADQSRPGTAATRQQDGLITTVSMGEVVGPVNVIAVINSESHVAAIIHETNASEIEAATLAQSRATWGVVRDFARMLIEDHTALEQQWNQILERARIVAAMPDSSIPAATRRDMQELQRPKGVIFDRAFVGQQVYAHQRALAFVEASLYTTRNPEITAMLRDQLRPKLTAHLRRAQELARVLDRRP